MFMCSDHFYFTYYKGEENARDENKITNSNSRGYYNFCGDGECCNGRPNCKTSYYQREYQELCHGFGL